MIMQHRPSRFQTFLESCILVPFRTNKYLIELVWEWSKILQLYFWMTNHIKLPCASVSATNQIISDYNWITWTGKSLTFERWDPIRSLSFANEFSHPMLAMTSKISAHQNVDVDCRCNTCVNIFWQAERSQLIQCTIQNYTYQHVPQQKWPVNHHFRDGGDYERELSNN